MVHHSHNIWTINFRKNLNLLGVIILGFGGAEICLDNEELILPLCEEGLTLTAIPHRACDTVGLNESIALHDYESKN
jgi:hypothetical protein